MSDRCEGFGISRKLRVIVEKADKDRRTLHKTSSAGLTSAKSGETLVDARGLFFWLLLSR